MKITMEWLEEKKACRSGMEWFAAQSETDAENVCRKLLAEDHFNWASWTIVRCLDHPDLVLYACFAARLALHIYEARCPGDLRPRKAIEAAEAWVKNPCGKTRADAADAADTAAYAVAYAAADAVAYAAAEASANAAARAADAARAGYAATKSAIIEYGIELINRKETEMTPTQEQIQMMKNNREALCFWPEELQKWAEENRNEFGFLKNKAGDLCRVGCCDMGAEEMVYRLRPDYELPQERWFYSTTRQELLLEKHCFKDVDGWIEVPPEILDYVRDCLKRDDIGEFEFRVPKAGDWYILPNGQDIAKHLGGHDSCFFVRKPKPEPEPESGWREYDIQEIYRGLHVMLNGEGFGELNPNEPVLLSIAWLHAIDCGLSPQFRFETGPVWFSSPNLMGDKPRRAAKMRVWK